MPVYLGANRISPTGGGGGGGGSAVNTYSAFFVRAGGVENAAFYLWRDSPGEPADLRSTWWFETNTPGIGGQWSSGSDIIRITSPTIGVGMYWDLTFSTSRNSPADTDRTLVTGMSTQRFGGGTDAELRAALGIPANTNGPQIPGAVGDWTFEPLAAGTANYDFETGIYMPSTGGTFLQTGRTLRDTAGEYPNATAVGFEEDLVTLTGVLDYNQTNLEKIVYGNGSFWKFEWIDPGEARRSTVAFQMGTVSSLVATPYTFANNEFTAGTAVTLIDSTAAANPTGPWSSIFGGGLPVRWILDIAWDGNANEWVLLTMNGTEGNTFRMFRATAAFTGTPTFTPAATGTSVQLPDAATRAINTGSPQRISVDSRNGNVVLQGTSTSNAVNFYALPNDFSTRTDAGSVADGVREFEIQSGFAWKIDHNNDFLSERSLNILPDTSAAYTAASLNNGGFNTEYYEIPAGVTNRPQFSPGELTVTGRVSRPVAGPGNSLFLPLTDGRFLRIPDATMAAGANGLTQIFEIIGDGTVRSYTPATGTTGLSGALTLTVFYQIA